MPGHRSHIVNAKVQWTARSGVTWKAFEIVLGGGATKAEKKDEKYET